MKGQGARVSVAAFNSWFKYDVDRREFFITRHNMELIVELFNSDIRAMKRVDKMEENTHGKMVTPGGSLSREKDRTKGS